MTLIAASFKNKPLHNICTQEINNLGANYNKKPVKNRDTFIVKLRKVRKERAGVNSKDKRGYQTVLDIFLNQEFEWPVSQPDKGKPLTRIEYKLQLFNSFFTRFAQLRKVASIIRHKNVTYKYLNVTG